MVLTRSVTLPAGADAEKVTARYYQGVLKVSVPVPEQAKPERYRIAIQHHH